MQHHEKRKERNVSGSEPLPTSRTTEDVISAGGEISYMTKQKLIMFISFIQPVAFGSWLLRIPDVQAKLRRGPAELAFALLGMPTGTLLTLPVAGRLVARIGR